MSSWRDAGAVVVLTALSLEYQAVRTHLTGLGRITHPHGTVFEIGRLSGLPVRIALGRTGEGNVAAAVLAGRAIEMFDPRAVFFVGVAGALKNEPELGDVVVATRVYGVHGGKEEGEDFLARPHSFDAAHELLEVAEYLNATGIWQNTEPDRPVAGFRVHFKPIAAGDVVLNSRNTPLARQLHAHYNDAIAIEMESAGAAAAAHRSRGTAMLTVRGISDRADGFKHAADAGGGQQTAAAHAAEVAFAVIREWAENQPPGYLAPYPSWGTQASSAVASAPAHDWIGNALVQQPAPTVTFPCQVGVVPPEAECFQERAVSGALEAALSEGSTAVLCQVLSGGGGVGKTQVAARYARSRWASGGVEVLVWLTAGNRESVVSQYARAAAKVAASTDQDPEIAARDFLAWLATTRRTWLVVLDDLSDPGDLTGLWPPVHATGQAVVTTRRRDAALVGSGRRRVDVEVFARDEATAYLTAKLAAHRRSDDPAQIAGLVRDLGYLPIAIAQAVAYLVDAGLDCAGYRARWMDRRRTLPGLVPQDGALPDDQQAGLAASWSLSVQRANALEPVGLAGPMLELASLLDPNGIPLSVLTSPSALRYVEKRRSLLAVQEDEGPRAPVERDEACDALAALARLSLCTVDLHSAYSTVRVHALVQRATRESLSLEVHREAAHAVADALLAAWPEIESDGTLSLTLRSNTQNLDDNARDELWQPNAHAIFSHAGTSLGQSGLYAEAVAYFDRLHRQAINVLGRDHPHTLDTRRILTTWQGEAGDPVGAVAAFREVLADHLRVLGPDHPQTLEVRYSLARSWGATGHYASAAAALEELLTDEVRVLGPDSPRALVTRRNLAHWRGKAGDAAGALAAFREVLTDQLRVLGRDHPDTLITRNSIALWQGEAGDPRGAVAAFEELLADDVRVLGPDHVRTLTTRYDFAYWQGQAGDPVGAVAALEGVLADQLRVFGPDSPRTLVTRRNLAYWRGKAGDLHGAIAAFEELLADDMRVLGPDHHRTLDVRRMIAYWQYEAGDAVGAIAALEVLLRDCLRVLGSDNYRTLRVGRDLARWRLLAESARDDS